MLVIATAVQGFLPGASPVPRLCRSESLISDAFRCQRRSAGAVTPFMALSGGEKVSQSMCINTIFGVPSIRRIGQVAKLDERELGMGQVAVLGVLERIGICVAKDLVKSPYKAVTQV